MTMDNDNETTTRRRHHSKQTEIQGGGACSPSRTKLKKKKKRKRKRDDDDLPFSQLVLAVGATLFVICCVCFVAYRRLWSPPPPRSANQFEYDDDDDAYKVDPPPQAEGKSISDAVKNLWQAKPPEEMMSKDEPETPPPIPFFNLSEASLWDAFGIILQQQMNNNNNTASTPTFWHAAKGLRQRFADTYGGENAARMLLDKGLTTFDTSLSGGTSVPQDVVSTACRFQRAELENRPFRLAFAGYSVTVGRGNLFQQSFPFQLQTILNTVVQLAGITEGLQVRNAAIGGIPAFPYGFCFRNFLGTEPDVISWDYSMNEAGGVPEGLEAYVRHMITTYSSYVPKLIVKDTHMATLRQHVLHDYKDWLQDSVILHTDPATKPFLERDEAYRPVGFQEWRKFGAPYGAPGQAHHHPALKEHEMMGWILAMHFLTALEYKMSQGMRLKCPDAVWADLPPPVSGRLTNNTNATYDPILFGSETATKDKWTINPVHCRTTFQPILTGDLSEVVASGSIAEDLDGLLPKSQMYYNDGWVLDMSEGEKAAKRKLSLYENDLGFIDSKEAYYGIYESPKLNLFLPFSSSSSSASAAGQETPNIGDAANDWYQSLVLCQVNEKRSEKACNFGSDVALTIGGVNVTSISEYMMKDAGTLYLGKQVCSHIPVPNGATLTSHNALAKSGSELETDQVGVLIQVFVANAHIVHVKQACSVSHVVWEEKRKQ